MAIHDELLRLRAKRVPSVRTIGRILERRGALDARQRVRRNPPPPGWYLADLADAKVELDSFDIVEGLVIRGSKGKRPVGVEVFNGISLHGGLMGSWPRGGITAKNAMDSLLEHWHHLGLPAYVQFDNDRIFAGAHARPDTFGRVIRMCLSLGVTPVFPRPEKPASRRQWRTTTAAGKQKSGRVSSTTRFRASRPSPNGLSLPRGCDRRRGSIRPNAGRSRATRKSTCKPRGSVIFLRRTDAEGHVSLLGHTFNVSATWTNRLVRTEVDLDEKQVRFYALRRREPTWQPLLKTHGYQPPDWHFTE